jgi:hypothetical protein
MAVMQLQLALSRDAVPLTRDYLAEETRRLLDREAELAGRGARRGAA